MINRNGRYITVIAASILLITYLHYSTAMTIYVLHDIYREFYYLPVFIGALVFGLRGAVLSFMFIFVLYLPFIVMNWSGSFTSEANEFLHLLLQGLFALLSGFLIDRDRHRREQLEQEEHLACIGQVATTIVHDLKNPLITVLGFAKRIKEGKGETDSAVQSIIDSANTMQTLVYDVLDFAKPLKLELKEVDIGNVIRQACDACKTKTERWGVNILTYLPDGPVKISVDSFNFQRAIVNIIHNAIEASSKGQSVTVNAAAHKNYLTVKIRDQGSGMDRETLENIFTPFYTKKQWGTGLGMLIAKKVIDGHHGKIFIESHPGKGTEAIIELPREGGGDMA